MLFLVYGDCEFSRFVVVWYFITRINYLWWFIFVFYYMFVKLLIKCCIIILRCLEYDLFVWKMNNFCIGIFIIKLVDNIFYIKECLLRWSMLIILNFLVGR